MPKICIDCVKEINLKRIVEKFGISSDCHVCGEKNKVTIESEDEIFFQLTKAILRFNYSEWEYNHHLGGTSFEETCYGDENIFFHQSRASSEEVYEELVMSIIDGPVYEDYDKGVCIFSGYDENGHQNQPLRSIKTTLDSTLLEISKRLKNENYFNFEPELKSILKEYEKVATKHIAVNKAFYRARVGVEQRKRYIGMGWETEEHLVPYQDSQIGAPPPFLSSSGRVNRPGVSFFYCATDKYTAVSEVRPHPGDFVSIGQFTVKKNLKLFNLSDSQIIHFCESDEALDSFIQLHTLAVFLNKVISPSERGHYSITQLIADCIRQLEFDGIMFSSSVGKGENLVIFDSSNVEYTKEDRSVIEVKMVEYQYSYLPLFEQDDGLYID